MNKQNSEQSKASNISSFPRVFWIANLLELFERGAYYGMNSLLAIYLTDKVVSGGLGFREDEVGLLQGVVYAVTYVVPILGGALADRYGYRRMLLIAFSFLTLGYFSSGMVDSYGVIFAALLVMATGSGLFKPIISGTIARSTNEGNSGFGFGIYYWMINLGALLAPWAAGLLKVISWKYVFIASSAYCALMFIPVVIWYRDPPKPESTKKLREVLSGAATVLSDARFMLLIFVYSCFWILYFQNFGTVLWYLRDFVDTTPVNSFFLNTLGIDFHLETQHVTCLNAATIVFLQYFVSKIVRNRPALPTMITGVVVGALGFLVIASSQHGWIFIAGIVVFSIGEMTCHPKYYSYIGLVAPADKKAIYMGYSFLYGVIGSLVGSNLGGEMYHAFLSPLVGNIDAGGDLFVFWVIFALLGLVTAGALMVYNILFGKDTEVTRKRARRVMLAIYSILIVGAIGLVSMVASSKGQVPAKTAIQAGIMLVMGVFGLVMLLRPNKESQA